MELHSLSDKKLGNYDDNADNAQDFVSSGLLSNGFLKRMQAVMGFGEC